jgi:hypothetical protein
MKNFPSYKFLRFFITDREVILRSAVLLVLAAVILFQLNTLRGQNRQLAALKAGQKAEETRTQQQSRTPYEAPKDELVLEGVTLKFGAPYAVISGQIYKVGDEIGNYTLSEIGQGFIVLDHNDKDESKKINFSQRLPGDVF